MADVIYVVGHKSPDTDTICSAIGYAEFKNKLEGNNLHKPARAGELNKETKFALDKFGVKEPELVKNFGGKRVILIDHSETKQMPDGCDKADIIEVIDHHKIGDIQTTRPILFHAEPLGSTSTIVADFYFNHKIILTKSIAGLLLSSILSDTVIFKSPTTTKKDEEMAKRLAEVAGVDAYRYGMELKKAKSSIKGLRDEDVIFADFKDFDMFGKKVGIGQIEVVDPGEALQRKEKILKKMTGLLTEKGYHAVFLMVTDILKEGTDLWAVGEELAEIEKRVGKLFEKNSMHIDGMMSRKKELVPILMEAYK